jgi:hypothetical protein
MADLQEYAAEQQAARTGSSWLGNAARGIAERAAEDAGSIVRFLGTMAEGAGDYMERRFPLGRIEFGPNGVRHVRSAPEDIDADSEVGRWSKAIARSLEGADFGYQPRTTWEDVKAHPVRSAVPFIAEQGAVSFPDMPLAMLRPELYAMALASQMAQARARNNNPNASASGR